VIQYSRDAGDQSRGRGVLDRLVIAEATPSFGRLCRATTANKRPGELEMFLWTRPLGLKTFRNTPEKAADSAVLAANQGLYNGFLAAGLIWGLLQGTPAFAFQIKVFFLLCVIIAGVYGAVSVSRRILYVQAAPAAIALILLWLV
jgi:putative membrane protein